MALRLGSISDSPKIKPVAVRIIDGDTFDVKLELSFIYGEADIRIKRTLRCRLLGVDCPERRKDRAAWEKAKKFTRQMLSSKEFQLMFKKSRRGKLIKDKYGRYLVDVFLKDMFLSEALLKNKLATKIKR